MAAENVFYSVESNLKAYLEYELKSVFPFRNTEDEEDKEVIERYLRRRLEELKERLK